MQRRLSPSVSPSGHDGLWARSRRGLTVGLVLSSTLIASEALAVTTIMPRVARDLGALDLYGWVFSAFMLGSIVGTVAAGRAADWFGPARPFAAGLGLFAAGLAVAGLAPSMVVLVLGRAVQGVGAGAAPAISYVAIGRALPERLRPHMLATLSTAWVLPGLVGPVLSAEVARVFGWRWVFLGLLPLVALAGLPALPALARLGRQAGDGVRTDASDHRLLDAVRVAGGTGLLLAALSDRGLTSAVLALAGAALIGLPALRRLLPAGALSGRAGLPAVVVSRGLLMFAFFGGDAFVTLAIVTVLHHSTALAGAVITSSTMAWTAGAWLQVRLSARWELRALIGAGLVLVLAGIAGMIVSLRPGIGVGAAVIAWSVAGLGTGLAYAPTSLLTMREAPAGRAGWASASLTLCDVLGTALGAGVGGAAIVIGSARAWPLSSSVSVAFAVAGAGAILALALTRRLPRVPRRPPRAGADVEVAASEGARASHFLGQGAL